MVHRHDGSHNRLLRGSLTSIDELNSTIYDRKVRGMKRLITRLMHSTKNTAVKYCMISRQATCISDGATVILSGMFP